jgi:penicillin-binding protein 1A
VAYVATQMLKGTIERGTGIAAKALGRPAAAKTGTTNDYSNAWFIGFTPRLATGVWVGYDRPRSLGKDETGSRVAVPIWVGYMGRVLGDSPKEDFPVPDRVVSLLIDEDPSGECLRPVPMAFVKGSESGVVCNGVGQPRAQVSPASPPPASQPPIGTPAPTPASPPNPVPQSQTP